MRAARRNVRVRPIASVDQQPLARPTVLGDTIVVVRIVQLAFARAARAASLPATVVGLVVVGLGLRRVLRPVFAPGPPPRPTLFGTLVTVGGLRWIVRAVVGDGAVAAPSAATLIAGSLGLAAAHRVAANALAGLREVGKRYGWLAPATP